jgi:ornithine cyclodeaminase/alanine dehydrogenase-like protein (mu-crystallin family)
VNSVNAGPRAEAARSEEPAAVILALAERIRAGVASGAFDRMVVPLRGTVEDAAGTKYISMPAVSPDYRLFINKTATIVPAGTPGRAATITAVVPMFSTVSGELLGVLDGATVTNLKCAAVTALVTDACAAPDARLVGIIGSGVQARQQYRGISAVRQLDEVRIYSRSAKNVQAFARYLEQAGPDGLRVTVCDSIEQASRGVDILATTTTSTEPLPISAELPEHVHINCMGAHTTESRELSQALLCSSVLIVEDLPTAIAEAGELHRGAKDLAGLVATPVEELRGQRTIFSSTGCASLDLVTCAHLNSAPYG